VSGDALARSSSQRSEWIVGDPYTGLSRLWRWKAFYELRVIPSELQARPS
jgi:hypothetical protein